MRALAREGIEVESQRGREGLALARAHLRDPAFVQHHAADELHIEMAHLEDALAGLPADGEGFRQELVEGFPFRHALLKSRGHGLEILIAQGDDVLLQGIDHLDLGPVALKLPLVLGAEYFFEELIHHGRIQSLSNVRQTIECSVFRIRGPALNPGGAHPRTPFS